MIIFILLYSYASMLLCFYAPMLIVNNDTAHSLDLKIIIFSNINPFNTVILECNLVRDPEAKLTPKGTPVCKFSVASNHSYKVEGVRQ